MDSETQKTDTLYELLAWLEVNKKQVAIGSGLAVLLIGIVVAVVWFKGQTEFQASEALSAVRIPVNPSEPLPPDTVDKLQKVAAEYPRTEAAVRADLMRAGLLYSTGKYAEAQAAFEKFLQAHPESRWVSEAFFGVAVCLDALNKTNEAIAKYEDFGRRFPSDPKVDQERLNLGALHEAANKPAEAVKEYERIVKSTTPSPFQSEAQERLRRLLAKYPNLAPTNAPVLSPTLPVQPVPLGTGAVPLVRTNLAPGASPPLVRPTNLVSPKPVPAPTGAK